MNNDVPEPAFLNHYVPCPLLFVSVLKPNTKKVNFIEIFYIKTAEETLVKAKKLTYKKNIIFISFIIIFLPCGNLFLVICVSEKSVVWLRGEEARKKKNFTNKDASLLVNINYT
jgi:hypothetical protein